jgi:hypothetical protein
MAGPSRNRATGIAHRASASRNHAITQSRNHAIAQAAAGGSHRRTGAMLAIGPGRLAGGRDALRRRSVSVDTEPRALARARRDLLRGGIAAALRQLAS